MGTGFFPGVKSGRGVTLTSHHLLVPWSRKSRAIPLLPQWTVRPVQSLSDCTRVNLTPYLTLPDGPWSWTGCGAVDLRIGVEQGFQVHVTPVPFATVRRRVWGWRLDDLQGKSWSFLYMTKIYWIWWTSNTSLPWPPRFLCSPGQTTISTIRWSHFVPCHGNPVSVSYTILHEITSHLFHRNGRTIGESFLSNSQMPPADYSVKNW